MLFCFVTSCTPGPNNIILSTNAVNYGFKATIPLMLGVFFGFLSVLTLCLLGIGEIYENYPNFKNFIKIVATIFLTYLAYKIFISTDCPKIEKIGRKYTKNFIKRPKYLNDDTLIIFLILSSILVCLFEKIIPSLISKFTSFEFILYFSSISKNVSK